MFRSKLFAACAMILFLLCSCGKKPLELPEGYPTAYFPLCGCVEIVRADISGLEEKPVYSVDYESSLSADNILTEYMLTIPKSKVADTETGYKLSGKKEGFRYMIEIETAEKSRNKETRSLVRTSVTGNR